MYPTHMILVLCFIFPWPAMTINQQMIDVIHAIHVMMDMIISEVMAGSGGVLYIYI